MVQITKIHSLPKISTGFSCLQRVSKILRMCPIRGVTCEGVLHSQKIHPESPLVCPLGIWNKELSFTCQHSQGFIGHVRKDGIATKGQKQGLTKKSWGISHRWGLKCLIQHQFGNCIFNIALLIGLILMLPLKYHWHQKISNMNRSHLKREKKAVL